MESLACTDPVRILLSLQKQFPDRWSTLNAQTLTTFQQIFDEVQGRGKSFLEIGSGHGFTCVLFALLGAKEVHGIELVPSAVRFAEEVRHRVNPNLPVFFYQGDVAQGLPYSDEAFDVVILVEVISHVVFDDLGAFISEMVRVLKPGGFLYLSDGNNARSWKRRRENYRIWKRFDQGPRTREGETVYSHKIVTPYVDIRREIVRETAPSLSREEVDTIASQTFRFTASQVKEAVRRYAELGELPKSPFSRCICPIDPVSGQYIEQLIDPFEVRRHLRAARCDEVFCGPRRRLPFQLMWATYPWLTFFVTNGFKIVARKK